MLLSMLTIGLVNAQITFNGNGNSDFGGAVGQSSMTIDDDGTTVTVSFTKGPGQFNDAIVIYIDAAGNGRSQIDSQVNDQADDLRRAISSAGASASIVDFPPGFFATHAIAIDTNFGGLWQIPVGSVGDGGLNFVTSVNSSLNSNTQSSFTFSFDWTDIGRTGAPTENIDFQVTYLNGQSGCTSNEGYGGGFPATTACNTDLDLQQYFRYKNNLATSGPAVGGRALSAQSGDFTSDATWVNGNIPFDQDVVIVQDTIDIDVNAVLRTVTLQGNGLIRINDGTTLNITNRINTNDQLFVSGELALINATVNGLTTFQPTGRLYIDSGNTIINGDVLFMSDSNGSGQLKEVVGSLTMNGDVTVERYIPAATNNTRGYRFLTSAVTTNGSIFDNWQEGGASPAGFGTQITGPGGATNGFDTTGTNNPSMFSFNNNFGGPQENSWNTVPNTNMMGLTAGTPYRIYIRGDRNYDFTSNPPNSPNSDVTLRATGDLRIGNFSFTASGIAGYYSFIGNPYQAIVNMADVTYSNVDSNTFYVWDPNLGTMGAYVAVDVFSGSNTSGSDANMFIMPGQAVFVQTLNNSSASVTFRETSKDADEDNTQVFSTENEGMIDIRLYEADRFDGRNASDGLALRFGDGYEVDREERDAGKMMNPGESIYTVLDGQPSARDYRPFPYDGDKVQLELVNYIDDSYVLELVMHGLSTDAYLADTFTGKELKLTEGQNLYEFVVEQDVPASVTADRFVVIFKSDAADVAEFNNTLKIYPNPASSDGALNILTGVRNTEGKLKLTTLSGQRVYSLEVSTDARGLISITLPELSEGVYLLSTEILNDTYNSKLIIK